MGKVVEMRLWSFFWVVVTVVSFVTLSYFVQTNLDFFEKLIVVGGAGMFVYVCLNIVATVFAPIAALPFIAVSVSLWGFWITIFLTLLGWMVGAGVAFLLARKFGVPIVKKFIPLENIYKFEDKISVGNDFWSVVFLRMIIPVDVLSYALGLFSKINFWKYMLATFIGIIPFTIIFAYLGEIPYVYLIRLGLGFLIGILGLLIFREMRGRN